MPLKVGCLLCAIGKQPRPYPWSMVEENGRYDDDEEEEEWKMIINIKNSKR